MARLHLVLGFVGLASVAAVAVAMAGPAAQAVPGETVLPAPVLAGPDPKAGLQTAIFAGGCFWGIQGVFQHVRGVVSTAAGYDGGAMATAHYEQVSGGRTGHAESVKVVFDPKQVGYAQLLRIFFSVALDPTQRGGQYPDFGSQYRSVVFATNDAQAQVAAAYVAQLGRQNPFNRPIATAVETDRGFFVAEAEHQNFLVRHPDDSYIALYDQPKIRALRSLFPASFRVDPILTVAPGS